MFTLHFERIMSAWMERNPFLLRLSFCPICLWLNGFLAADGFHSEKLGNYWDMKRGESREWRWKFEFSCRKNLFSLFAFLHGLFRNPLKFVRSKGTCGYFLEEVLQQIFQLKQESLTRKMVDVIELCICPAIDGCTKMWSE